jgi:hypothetical protein
MTITDWQCALVETRPLGFIKPSVPVHDRNHAGDWGFDDALAGCRKRAPGGARWVAAYG